MEFSSLDKACLLLDCESRDFHCVKWPDTQRRILSESTESNIIKVGKTVTVDEIVFEKV